MGFPITFEYDRKLRAVITPENEQQILQFIADYITKDKADNVAVQGRSVTCKGTTGGKQSLFSSIDYGKFILVYKNGAWYLTYQIYMQQLIIITGAMSVMFGAFGLFAAGSLWIGIFTFLWLCGANWAISVTRHGMEASEIVDSIDDLICGKPERIETAKIPGKLKSWF